jgi:hypothetical protein
MRHVRQRLDVVHDGGVQLRRTRDKEALHVRRKIRFARHGRTALDHFKECLLLTEQIILWTEDELDRDRPERLRRGHLVHRPPHRRDFLLEALLHAQIGRANADCASRNRHPLEQLVRIIPKEKAIFEGSWLSLGAVAHQVLRRTRIVRDTRPLHAGGEPRTATSAQARLLYLGDDRLRRHGERLLQCTAAVEGDVSVERRHRGIGQ